MPLSPSRGVICLVTDRHRLADASPSASLVDHVAAAAEAGVDLIQIRERDLEARELAGVVQASVGAIRGTGARIIVNDRADVAIASGAHGTHLRGDSFDAARMRSILPADFIIGRSVHDAGEAARVARDGGVDYLILGTFFPTPSKASPQRQATMTGLAAASAAASLPIIPIGGVTLERAEALVRAGAAGIAAIGLFLPPPGVSLSAHLHDVVSALRRLFDTCEAVP